MEIKEIINSIYLNASNLVLISLSISVLLCLFNFKKLVTPFKRLFYFLIWNLLIEVLARIFTEFNISNLPLLHVYTIGEFILFSWLYKSLIKKPKLFQQLFWPFVIIGSLLMGGYSLFFHGVEDYNPISKTVVQIIIITYAVLYFYNLTENQSHSSRFEKSLRLINSAILIYYSGSLFIFMCSQVLIDYPEWIKFFWGFNAVLNLIFQLMILWGIWKVVSKQTPLSS